jgi:hypothetical protein
MNKRQFVILKEFPEVPYFTKILDQTGMWAYLFNIKGSTVSRLVKAVFGDQWFVHRLRAERAMQLRDERHYDMEQLMRFFEWRHDSEARLHASTGMRALAARERENSPWKSKPVG